MTVLDPAPFDVQINVWRIICAGIDDAVALIARTPQDPAWLIHETRKSCKRWRSYLRLVDGEGREAARRANVMIRDAAMAMSDARDGAARLECLMLLEAATEDPEQRREISKLRQRLAADRCELDEVALLTQFQSDIRQVATFLGKQPEATGDMQLSAGILRSYRQVQKSWRRARQYPDAEMLHEWRKTVQRLKYQLRLPDSLARHEALDRLSDCLGEIHDLDVLADFLSVFDDTHTVKQYGGVLMAVKSWRAKLADEAEMLAAELLSSDEMRF